MPDFIFVRRVPGPTLLNIEGPGDGIVFHYLDSVSRFYVDATDLIMIHTSVTSCTVPSCHHSFILF